MLAGSPGTGAAVAGAQLPRTPCFVENTTTITAPDENRLDLREELMGFRAARLANSAPPVPVGLPRCSSNEVLVNIYELIGFGRMNELTAGKQFPLGGALHAGVEIYGREWSYGGGTGPGAGIVCDIPRGNRQHRFRETLMMGGTTLSDAEVAVVIGKLLESWRPEEYHWLHHNCLAFAHQLCEQLGVGPLPAWVDRFARGAGAVDLGIKAVTDSARGVAEGAHGVLMSLVGGRMACGHCASTPLCSQLSSRMDSVVYEPGPCPKSAGFTTPGEGSERRPPAPPTSFVDFAPSAKDKSEFGRAVLWPQVGNFDAPPPVFPRARPTSSQMQTPVPTPRSVGATPRAVATPQQAPPPPPRAVPPSWVDRR